MRPLRLSRGRRSAPPSVGFAILVPLALLAGCSSRPQELTGPARSPASSAAASAALPVVESPSSLLDRWEAPRIRVWTHAWRRIQKEGGVSLAPDRVFDFEGGGSELVTFHWSALPRTGQGEIVGYRWALDLEDILDETPRSDVSDLAHWSAWSLAGTEATVGPFDAGSGAHWFYVEARDSFGFVSLVPVRLLGGVAPGGPGKP